jgi:hypothetical protein
MTSTADGCQTHDNSSLNMSMHTAHIAVRSGQVPIGSYFKACGHD